MFIQGLGTKVAFAQGRAVNWLEKNLNLLETYGQVYEVALVAYALMLSNAGTAETAFRILIRHAHREGNVCVDPT